MKNYLRFLSPVMLLIMAVMFGGGKIYALKTVSLTLSSSAKFGQTSGSTLKQDDVTWKVTTIKGKIGNNYNNQTYKGQQFGVSGTPWQGTFSTSDIVGKITKIGVAANTGDAATLSVKVGNTDFLSSGKSTVTVVKKKNGINTYIFEGNATGEVVVSLKGTKKEACYLGSITVTYNEADAKTPTTLSFENKESVITYSVGDGEDGNVTLTNTAILNPSVANSNITYSLSNNTFDANDVLIDNDGTVIFSTKKEASATITASYAGNDTYEASTASYTIKVVKPATVEDGVFDFTGDGTIDYGSGLKPREEFDSNEFLSATWVAGNVKVDMQKIRWMYSDVESYIRFYKSQKSNFTVTVPSGYFITNIRLGGAWSFVANCGSYNSKNGKWNGLSNSVTFDYNQSVNSKNINLTNIEVTYIKTETLTTSAGGYATYSADYAVNYSELGLTAYTITIDEGNTTVTAKEFTGVVPAGKAVLVKGTGSKAYTLTPATTEGDATFATALQTGATTADGTQYGFTTKFGTPAFAQVVSGQDIPAKKGYIVLKGASAAKYSICFDGEATGIHTIEAASAANDAMYNLAGQRVDKAYKGIVIVNGKKYLNK